MFAMTYPILRRSDSKGKDAFLTPGFLSEPGNLKLIKQILTKRFLFHVAGSPS